MASDLEFRIGAELSEIKGALAGLKKDFASVGQAAQQAGNGQAFRGVETGARNALGAVDRLVAGFVTLAGAIKLIGAADELNTLNARIRLVTNSTEEYNRAQVALFDLAQRTRSSLGGTVDLYTRIAQSTKDSKVGQEVLLGVVETINQAVQLSGASAQAAEAALIQLGQGLGSGTLRGEELNSVLEQTPALADAIAKGMGITRGELRKYGEEGKITAEQVIKALQVQRDTVAQQFAQLPLTVGQSVTLLKNAGLQLVGAFDQTTSATSGVASVIKDLADFIASDQVIGAVIEFSATWSNAFRGLATDVQDAVRIVESATANITGDGAGLFEFLARAFRELPVNVRAAVKIATVEVAAFVDSTIAGFRGVAEYIRAVFDPNKTVASVRTALLRTQAAIEQARQESIDEALRERQTSIDDAAKARKDAEARRRQGRNATGSTSTGTFKTTQTDEQKRKAEALRKAELDAQEKLLKDASQRELGILQDLYQDGQIAAASYFEARERIELEALGRSLDIERRRLAGASDPAERTKALAEIELLERQKGDIQRKRVIDSAREQREIEKQVEQLRAQDLENQGQTAAATRIRLQAQYADLLKKLGADSEGARLIQRLIDTGVSKAQFDEIKRQAEAVIVELERRRGRIAGLVDTGAITPQQGREQDQAAQVDAAARLAPVNEQLQQLASTLKDPGLVQAANDLGDAIANIGREPVTGLQAAVVGLRKSLDDMQQTFAQSAVNAGADALTNFFTDLATGSKSAGDALKDFIRGFAVSMATLAARALATVIVLKALEAYTGIPASTLASLANVGANIKHAGGMAGTGPTRQVPALAFAGAPRFHNGSGVLGLKSDEIPAILQTGERVQSRAEVAAMQSGGGGTRIVNVIDPNLVQDYMTSAAGERTIVNVIQRNAGAVRQSLG